MRLRQFKMKTGQFEDVDITARTLTTPAADITAAEIESAAVKNATFDGDFELLDTFWTDLVMPLTQTRVGANNLPTFNTTEIAYEFPQNDATEILYFVVQLPHGYKEGTGLYPHVHWRQTLNLTPVFKLDYKWFNVGAAVPAQWSTYTMDELALPYTADTTIQQINKNSDPIAGTGKTISSILLCKLYRDDNVYTGDALAYQFDIHYEIDSFGSAEEYTK
jgi:hypothetical protein